MRSILKIALLATGIGVAALAVVALIVTFAPLARAQTLARDRSLAELRTQLLGGSQLGIEVRDVDATDLRREKLTTTAGAIVEDVRSSGPAAKAGIKAGDVIVSFDGETIRSARHLARLVEETPGGREVAAVVIRDGQKTTIKVTPVEATIWNDADALRQLRDFRLPERITLDLPEIALRTEPLVRTYVTRGSRLGVGVQDIRGQLAEYFGVKDGVLVTDVDEDTPAKAAGLKAGDVITHVGASAVRNTSDLRRSLAESTGEVKVAVVREKKEQTLTATIGDQLAVVRKRIIR